jgi:hypothetical protein
MRVRGIDSRGTKGCFLAIGSQAAILGTSATSNGPRIDRIILRQLKRTKMCAGAGKSAGRFVKLCTGLEPIFLRPAQRALGAGARLAELRGLFRIPFE